MGNIVLLDEHTINKIAAGEVVDRPSSIVKELVENSIDAKAKNITVEIKNGGISYIKITDDGTGIKPDDVEIAFERHATSKIRTEEDLHKITSMGFRGEALASIAAISKVTLYTKTKEEPVGVKACVEAGEIKSIEQVALNHGTTVQINDVFFNVPARYKFLKKDYTEAGYIEDVVTRIALVNPQISFKYINNGKLILKTNGNGDIKTVIYSIFGKDIYQNILELDFEYQNVKVEGVVGLSSISRSNRSQQFTYVNSRYVKNKTITTALDKAYDQQLEINKFAFAIVNVLLSPELIDVNVHPSKLEVKFSNEAVVFEAVYHAIKNALEKHNQITSPFSNYNYQNPKIVKEILDKNKQLIEQDQKIEAVGNVQNKPDIFGESAKVVVENIDIQKEDKKILEQKNQKVGNDQNQQKPYVADENDSETHDTQNVNGTQNSQQVIFNDDTNAEYIKEEKKEESKEDSKAKSIDNLDNSKYQQETMNKDSAKQPFKYIGCVFDTYIIIEMNQKMYIIDQHAAHERLLFEEIKQSYYSNQKQTQMLLIPILVNLTQKENDVVKQNLDMFKNVGFILEEFVNNTIKISGVPNVGYDIDYKSMFTDVIDELMGAAKTNAENKEWRFLATVACKAAVKGNMKLTPEEHINLIKSMMKLDRPFTCPHGRPTAIEISRYELERKFLRK